MCSWTYAKLGWVPYSSVSDLLVRLVMSRRAWCGREGFFEETSVLKCLSQYCRRVQIHKPAKHT